MSNLFKASRWVHDLQHNRHGVLHMVKLMALACVTLAVSLALAYFGVRWRSEIELPFRLLPAIAALFIGAYIIIQKDLARIWSHGFQLFSSGSGDFGNAASRGLGGFMPLATLVLKHRWHAPRGDIFLGRTFPLQRLFGLSPATPIGVEARSHMLTIAPARFGKGTTALIPNLIHYPGSVIMIDPKGENACITAARRGNGSDQVTAGLGQKVFVFNPEGAYRPAPGSDVGDSSWNPLDEFDPAGPRFLTDIRALCYILLPDNPNAQEKFYDDSARQLLYALILHVYSVEEPPNRNLIFVRDLIQGGDPEAVLVVEQEEAAEGYTGDPIGPHQALALLMASNTDYNGIIAHTVGNLLNSSAHETIDITWMTLRTKTDFLDSLRGVLQKSDFSILDLVRGKNTLFICINATSLKGSMNQIMRVFIEIIVKKFEVHQHEKKEYPALLIMDEFHSLGRIEVIASAMGLVSGFGLRLWPILQNYGQLEEVYPGATNNFLANVDCIQIFGSQDEKVIELINRRVSPEGRAAWSGASISNLNSGMLDEQGFGSIVLFKQSLPAVVLRCPYYSAIPASYYDSPSKHSP